MRTQNTTFTNAAGDILAASLDLPIGTPRAVALIAHCFTCGKDLPSIRRLANALAAEGIAVARFDFTGLGSSAGDFAHTGFNSKVADVVAAADWLRQTVAAPALIIGHSFGGAVAVAAAPRIPEVRAVVTVGAPSDPAHVTHLLSDSIDEINDAGQADVQIGAQVVAIGKTFVDDICAASLAEAMEQQQAALLVVHSPTDTIVEFEQAERLYAAAQHPKSLIALDGADHLLRDRRQTDRLANLITAWAAPYLPDRPTPSDDVLVPAAEGEVVVAEREPSGFAQVVRVANRHTLLADEPIGIGEDTGPAPYDLLLAALGTCTSMTVRMYAERKEWPLESVAVKLNHSKIHAKDCEECESTSGRIDRIERQVTLVGNLDDEQRQRLLEIADRCPVHRTLEGEIHVTTTEANA